MEEKMYLISDIIDVLNSEHQQLEKSNEINQYTKGKIFFIIKIINVIKNYKNLIEITLYTNSINYSVFDHIIENLKADINNIKETLKALNVSIGNSESFIKGYLDATNIIVMKLEKLKNK